MKKRKVLITDYVHESLITGLESMGYEVEVDTDIDNTRLQRRILDYYGTVINSKTKANNDFFERATKLKFVARLGSGLDIIDLESAARHDVAVLNSPEGNRNAVAEHVLGMLLCGANNIHIADREVRGYKWNREANRGIEINDKTIGIIGYGNVGSTLVKRLSGFDSKILIYDKYLKEPNWLPPNAKWVTLDELQKQSDIISIHVQLTPETTFFINKIFFEKCKVGLIFINTSRGKNLVLKDLLYAIDNKIVKLALLDVLENEKIQNLTKTQKNTFERLIFEEKIILTPHIAGWTKESLKRIAVTLLNKIKSLEIG